MFNNDENVEFYFKRVSTETSVEVFWWENWKFLNSGYYNNNFSKTFAWKSRQNKQNKKTTFIAGNIQWNLQQSWQTGIRKN